MKTPIFDSSKKVGTLGKDLKRSNPSSSKTKSETVRSSKTIRIGNARVPAMGVSNPQKLSKFLKKEKITFDRFATSTPIEVKGLMEKSGINVRNQSWERLFHGARNIYLDKRATTVVGWLSRPAKKSGGKRKVSRKKLATLFA